MKSLRKLGTLEPTNKSILLDLDKLAVNLVIHANSLIRNSDGNILTKRRLRNLDSNVKQKYPFLRVSLEKKYTTAKHIATSVK